MRIPYCLTIRISIGLIALVLLTAARGVAAQSIPVPPGCPGSTVDLQGADVAQTSRAFLSELQAAVKRDQREKIASMISYPLLVLHGTHRTHIRTKAQFLGHYDAIFTPHVRQAIARQSARCLFGNDQGAMIGNGEVWFSRQATGTMKIITVNPGAT